MHICQREHRVLVQGITGKQGTFWTKRMQEYGTNVIGGVNPKKAGTKHCDVPVYASAVSASKDGAVDATVMFIPPLGVKAAAARSGPQSSRAASSGCMSVRLSVLVAGGREAVKRFKAINDSQRCVRRPI